MKNADGGNEWGYVETTWGSSVTTCENAPEERWETWSDTMQQLLTSVQQASSQKAVLGEMVNRLVLLPREIVENHFGLVRSCVLNDGRVVEAELPRLLVLKRMVATAAQQAKKELTERAIRRREEENPDERQKEEHQKESEVSTDFIAGIAAAAAQAAVIATKSQAGKPTRRMKELPSFDGSTEKVNDFMITMLSVEGEGPTEKVQNIKALLPGMLEGSALAWLPVAREKTTLHELCDSLLMEYSGKSTAEHCEDFSSIKRKPTETCWDFWARCKTTRIAINGASQQERITEGTMVRAFRRGLGQGYESLATALFSRRTTSMHEVIEVMNEWSNCLQEKGADPHGIYATQLEVTGLPTPHTDLMGAISKLTAAIQPPPGGCKPSNTHRIDSPPFVQRLAHVVCHECKLPGHVKAHHYPGQRSNGPARTAYGDRVCKRCGKNGHTSIVCEASVDIVKAFQRQKERPRDTNTSATVVENAQLKQQVQALQEQMARILQSQGVAAITPAEPDLSEQDFQEARASSQA